MIEMKRHRAGGRPRNYERTLAEEIPTALEALWLAPQCAFLATCKRQPSLILSILDFDGTRKYFFACRLHQETFMIHLEKQEPATAMLFARKTLPQNIIHLWGEPRAKREG